MYSFLGLIVLKCVVEEDLLKYDSSLSVLDIKHSLILNLSIEMLIFSVFYSGYCLYGDVPRCIFQCHCAVDNECSRGTCPSGCDTSLPSGYIWSGPSCQIGNVGLHKSTNMTASDFYQKIYPATGALDGIIPNVINTHCAHPTNDVGLPVEWWTDLGDLYKIYNITIYARRDDNEILCGYHHDPVYTSITITCPSPLIGRYVHFMRRVGVTKDEAAPFCEIVLNVLLVLSVMTSLVVWLVMDPTSQIVNKAVKTDFMEQIVRINVVNVKLTHYVTGITVHVMMDVRFGGLIQNVIYIYIETPNNTHENLMLLNKTSDSIEIGWQHIKGISVNLRRFYGYLIQYRIDLDDTNYRDVGIVSYDSNPYWKIENLQINTIYYIKVTPYRKVGDLRETGKAYATLKVQTDCSAPDNSSFINATLTYSDNGLPNISVTWQMISSINPHCDHITGISLQYKLSTSTNVTSINFNPDVNMFVIVPDVEGQYDIKLIIENNKGYTSSSERRGIHVNAPTTGNNPQGQRSSPLSIPTIAGSLSVVVIVIIVVIVVGLLLWRRR
ncbi:hypothetical protein LSH36_1729g00000 [Paralvinella palmiformis]|uniref:Fibronectin type-III domain-containing protein n=1 Tax=Paralvinella palmiformis TaxID=53620 RepID=A0AAD9MN34_9ANNE|nr:hypothetical protein LSH36_1729g00000 [Paralvinella palmiformis]